MNRKKIIVALLMLLFLLSLSTSTASAVVMGAKERCATEDGIYDKDNQICYWRSDGPPALSICYPLWDKAIWAGFGYIFGGCVDLRNIGMKVSLVEIDYMDQAKWVEELASGQHDFYLMGYKAGIEEFLSTAEAEDSQVDSYNLVEPLFATKGEANFTGYSNAQVDRLLAQVSNINPALKEERHKKLKQINEELYKDLPVIVLFYIEKI